MKTITESEGNIVLGEGSSITFDPSNYSFGTNIRIGKNTNIHVRGRFFLGSNAIIGDDVRVVAETFVAGDYLFVKNQAEIGHGGCNSPDAQFYCGYGVFIGERAVVNIAKPVHIGNEVGIGDDVKIWTHGAYLDVLSGFPAMFESVKIGSGVWITSGTQINPGVKIYDDNVIGMGSIVTTSLEESRRFYAGNPCKVVKKLDVYNLSPQKQHEILVNKFGEWANEFNGTDCGFRITRSLEKIVDDTSVIQFSVDDAIDGRSTAFVVSVAIDHADDDPYRSCSHRFSTQSASTYAYYTDAPLGFTCDAYVPYGQDLNPAIGEQIGKHFQDYLRRKGIRRYDGTGFVSVSKDVLIEASKGIKKS